MEPDEYGHIWYRTDIFEELNEAIKFSEAYLKRLTELHLDFRWCVIGSTMALQSALIYQLYGHDTSGTASLTKKSAQKSLEAISTQSFVNFPTQRLETPKLLLKKITSTTDFKNRWDSLDIENCETIINFRNEFIHYLPQSWSIELSGAPALFTSCWTIIADLLQAPILYAHRVDEALLEDMQTRSRNILSNLRASPPTA